MTEHTQAGASEAQALEQLAHRLRRKLPQHRAATINQAIAEALEEFDGRPIREFVPILVEREVLDRLREARESVGSRPTAERAGRRPWQLAT